MPHVTILILGVPSGIAAYAGVTHLLIGAARRPRDATHLLFGLVCLSFAVHILAVLAMHTAASVADYVVIHKYAFGPSAVVSLVAILWFVGLYTGARPRRFLLAMSFWYALIGALHLSLPFGILYSAISGLRHVSLPWGEQIVVIRGTPNPLQILNQLFFLCMFAFFGYALVRQYRGGQRRRALLLGPALAPFLVARVFDPLIVLGLLDAPLTSQLAFLAIVIAMSLVLSHAVTQTEIELQMHQRHLHELVAARTAELTRANDQLAQEIHERTLLDVALQHRVEQLTALNQVADIGIRMNDLTVALQGMSEIVMSLFDARSTLLLLPPIQATDRHMLIGFERGGGALGPMRVDIELADMPLTTQVLTRGQSLLVPTLEALPLPPAVRAFVTTRQLYSTMLIPLAIPGTVIGVMFVATDQAGRTFSSDEVSLAETIAGDMSAAIDNTRLYQRAVAARERLTLLYQASQTISQVSLDPERLYAELHAAVANIMPTEAFAVILFDEAHHEADDVYLADKDGRWPGKRYSLANSFAGYMLRRNASVRIDDFSAFPQTEFAFELFGNEPDTESGVAALMRGSERTIGLLFVQSYAKGAYSVYDEEALKLLAAHAAVALENAQRYHQARDLATSAERTRLARELHDAVTQTLYSASLLAEALPAMWRRDSAAGERDVAILRQLVRGALAEMRTLLFELRPSALAAADLATLLKQLGDRLTGNTRIPVALTIDGEAQLPAEVKIAVYRIAQEAFNNIAKHAGATQVWVTLRAEDGRLFLSVRDDGRGFDPNRVAGDHLGTQIMAERAAGIGAQLRIDSTPRRGAEVSISWPDSSASQGDKVTG